MSETVIPAPSTPAPEAKSDAPKAANLSASELAQRFLTPEPATQPAEQVSPETKSEAPTPAAETEQPAPAADTPVEETAETQSAETDTEEEAHDALSHKLDPETQKKIDKRIGKEVAKRKALEAKIAEMEAKLATPPEAPQQPAIVPLPPGAPPLANVEDVNSLTSLHQQAKEAIRFAEAELDKEESERDPELAAQWPRKALKEVLRNAKVTMEDHIPARFQFLKARQQADQEAYKAFPFLKEKENPLYVKAQSLLTAKESAWLRSVPASKFIVGAYIKGIAALEAEQAAAAKEKPKKVDGPKPPSSQTAVSASSTVRTPANAEKTSSVEYDKLKAKGGVSGSEFAAFLARKELSKSR